MNKLLSALAAAFALAGVLSSTPQQAVAGDRHGDFMIRGLVTGILPDASATVKAGGARVAGAGAEVSDEVVPATTLTYFFTDNWAVELLCCFAKHDVTGTGVLAGVDLGSTWIFPPALTAQYHFNPEGTFKPYVGVGVQYIHFFDEESKDLGTSFALDDGFGFTLQGGIDIAVGEGWYLNADVRKTWLGMDARWGGTPFTADVDLDPLIVSAGFGYRFNLSDLLGGHGSTVAYEELK
ncbi:MAG: OmpW family outer membrane protein [Methyloceanibacter sp.]|nr:OmpW family outer membrane protein [Methyloceanibacter sp.]